jgi:hypothetical protein
VVASLLAAVVMTANDAPPAGDQGNAGEDQLMDVSVAMFEGYALSSATHRIATACSRSKTYTFESRSRISAVSSPT